MKKSKKNLYLRVLVVAFLGVLAVVIGIKYLSSPFNAQNSVHVKTGSTSTSSRKTSKKESSTSKSTSSSSQADDEKQTEPASSQAEEAVSSQEETAPVSYQGGTEEAPSYIAPSQADTSQQSTDVTPIPAPEAPQTSSESASPSAEETELAE